MTWQPLREYVRLHNTSNSFHTWQSWRVLFNSFWSIKAHLKWNSLCKQFLLMLLFETEHWYEILNTQFKQTEHWYEILNKQFKELQWRRLITIHHYMKLMNSILLIAWLLTHGLISYLWPDLFTHCLIGYSLLDCLLLAWLFIHDLIVYSLLDYLLIAWLFTHCLIVYSLLDCLLLEWLFTHALIVYPWLDCLLMT